MEDVRNEMMPSVCMAVLILEISAYCCEFVNRHPHLTIGVQEVSRLSGPKISVFGDGGNADYEATSKIK